MKLAENALPPSDRRTRERPMPRRRHKPLRCTCEVRSPLGGMFHKPGYSERVLFTNTLLQRGVGVRWKGPNDLSGFRQGVETVEIEAEHPLKRGMCLAHGALT